MDAIKFKKLLKAETGQKWKIQKLHTETGDYVVFKNKETGEYSAYNMEKFDRKGKMSYDEFMAVAIDGTDIITNLNQESKYVDTSHWSTNTEYEGDWVWDDYNDEWDWCSTCGSSYTYDVWVESGYTYYWYTGNGFSFSNTELNVSRDLETLSGMAESVQVNLMSLAIQSELSLSSNRAKELAKLSVKFNKLENIRELSSKEKDYFAVSALGVSYSDLSSAYKDSKTSNSQSFKTLMEKAAKVNDTTSENLESYVSEYLSVELE
jgi:hypothetical protein